ncbi:hypothetical protein ACPOL_2056 [Acidisarcina polymorpha]|uniref:Uncharacterized protein n=1 Tax=Acidisarcina polymorpha TaxID=2211140 RepID=A0A2Z5FX89_9BACT|nr:hypothetical protein ACPOL_2056 [Acidisarcina polymorpha]
MAFGDTPDRKKYAFRKTMTFDRENGVFRARGLKAAAARNPHSGVESRREPLLVANEQSLA